jgi:hypothetical protein
VRLRIPERETAMKLEGKRRHPHSVLLGIRTHAPKTADAIPAIAARLRLALRFGAQSE